MYEMKLNEGYVNVGIDHDIAEFTVKSIRKRWDFMGKKRYIGGSGRNFVLVKARSSG